MRLYTILIFFFAVWASGPLAAQSGNPAAAADKSLQTQFDEMLAASNRFQTFKVVKQTYLSAFMTNVSDSIANYTNEISELKEEMATQKQEIDNQATEINDRDASIAALESEKDSVSLLGIQLSKAMYSIIMWSLVIGLLIAFLVAIASTRVAVSGTGDLKRERDKLAGELEQSRKSRLAVEQDLRRKLQDEINRRKQA